LLTGSNNKVRIFTINFCNCFFIRKNRESSGFEVSELVVGPGEQNINRAIFDIELTISQSGHRNMQVKTRTSILFPLYPRTIVRLYNRNSKLLLILQPITALQSLKSCALIGCKILKAEGGNFRCTVARLNDGPTKSKTDVLGLSVLNK